MKLAIIDFNRTIYDPTLRQLIDGAVPLLDGLARRNISMVLFSRDEGGREDVLDALGVRGYFSETVFVPEKTAAVVREIMRRQSAIPVHTCLLGDHLEDMRVGNEAGVFTIRYKQGVFADDQAHDASDTPRAVVHTLVEALVVIVRLAGDAKRRG